MSLTHHDGISVYGSGLAYGKKSLEKVMIDCSGNTTSSLHIKPQSLDNVLRAGTYTGIRMDGGTFSVSGWKNQNVSTILSSILFAKGIVVYPRTGLTGMASGLTSIVGTAFSGNQIDFTMYFQSVSGVVNTVGGGLTSSGTSSQISWVAFGL